MRLKRSCFFVCLCSVAWVFAAAPPKPKTDSSDPWRFANVKEWRVSISIDSHDDLEKKEDGFYGHYQAIVTGKVDVKLTVGGDGSETIHASNGDKTEWPSELTVVTKSYEKHTDSQGKETWTETDVRGAGPVIIGAVSLIIRPDDGTFTVQRSPVMFKKVGFEYTSSGGPGLKQEMPYSLPFNWAEMRAKPAPLPKTGMELQGSETFDGPLPPFAKSSDAKRDIKTTIKWTLIPWKEDAGNPKIEGPTDWLPTADNDATIKATWKGTASEIKYTLYDVSKEKGTCLNSADKGADPDLSIAAGGGFKVEKVDEKTWTATAKVAGDNISQLTVKSHDYGAWGKVKCELKIDGKWKTAKAAGGKDYLSLPKDDNENHIADSWEKEKGVDGMPGNWDQAEVAGQTKKGDGMALYEKYRGVFVLEGGTKKFKRLTPKEKCHFVVDPDGLFDFERWYRTSGIRAYKISKDMADADRRVDFNVGTDEAGGKYTSVLEKVDGFDGDPTSMQYGATAGGVEGEPCTPKMVDYTKVYPDRVGGAVDRVLDMMKQALNNPTTQKQKEEAARLESIAQSVGMTLDELKQKIANFDSAARKDRVDKMVALTAIHEIGHCCGLVGHLIAGQKKEDEDVIRNPSCPMMYLDTVARRRFVLFGELGGDGAFCKVGPDFCWKGLNPKN